MGVSRARTGASADPQAAHDTARYTLQIWRGTMKDWLPWAVLVFGAMMTWAVIYWKSEDFRKATIGSLLVAKTFTGVYALAGLDRVVYTLYLVHKSTGVVRPIHITACEILFLSFLSALAFTLAWPALRERLPREIRSAYEVCGE